MIKRIVILLMLSVALLGNQSAQAAPQWSDVITHSDFAGNGQLQVNYRVRLGYSVGFYVESVRICADGGVLYRGAGGRGLSVFNEDGVVKFSRGADASSVDKGDCKAWDTEISMPDASTLKAGWLFTDIFVPGDDVNQCARLTIHHSDWDSGC